MTSPPKPYEESRENEAQSRRDVRDRIPVAEWITAALGLLLLAGALWVLVSRGVDQPQPPSITVDVEEITPVAGAWLVRFAATNRGDETVAGLRLAAKLSHGSTVVETADVQLDYVPARSVRRGGLFLSHDPASGTLEITPSTFSAP